MKPSELLRKTKNHVVRYKGYACITMKVVLGNEGICDYVLADSDTFLKARDYMWHHRDKEKCEGRHDAYWFSHQERIEGITKAIADAEAAGE